MIYLWVAAGGAIGAMSRFALMNVTSRLIGHGFPWGTLCVNILGCFIMGALIEYFALRTDLGSGLRQEMRIFLQIGCLGGFTTFSAFSLDAVTLMREDRLLAAGGYIFASVILSITAFLCAMALFRMILMRGG